eukprot:514561-Rhodomonas_salina.1
MQPVADSVDENTLILKMRINVNSKARSLLSPLPLPLLRLLRRDGSPLSLPAPDWTGETLRGRG